MKRWFAVACLAVLPLMAFAQNGPARPGFPGMDWKAGTSMTATYQELTGTVLIGERVVPVLKVKDVEYLLMAGSRDPSTLTLKNGATVAFKGVATKITQAGQPDKYLFRPFEASIDGQTVKFERLGMGAAMAMGMGFPMWHRWGNNPGPQGGPAQ